MAGKLEGTAAVTTGAARGHDPKTYAQGRETRGQDYKTRGQDRKKCGQRRKKAGAA
jgi:hypothetical protein